MKAWGAIAAVVSGLVEEYVGRRLGFRFAWGSCLKIADTLEAKRVGGARMRVIPRKRKRVTTQSLRGREIASVKVTTTVRRGAGVKCCCKSWTGHAKVAVRCLSMLDAAPHILGAGNAVRNQVLKYRTPKDTIRSIVHLDVSTDTGCYLLDLRTHL